MDNIFLFPDIIDVYNGDNISVSIVSLDQEKVFDRVITLICFLHLRCLVLMMFFGLGEFVV